MHQPPRPHLGCSSQPWMTNEVIHLTEWAITVKIIQIIQQSTFSIVYKVKLLEKETITGSITTTATTTTTKDDKEIRTSHIFFNSPSENIQNGQYFAIKVVNVIPTQQNIQCQTLIQNEIAITTFLASSFHDQVEFPFVKCFAISSSFSSSNIIGTFLFEWMDGDLVNAVESLRNNSKWGHHHLPVIYRQCLNAIHELHKLGIVHRDIKPENFLFRYRSSENPDLGIVIKLADFGFASIQTFATGTQLTLSYCSPPYLMSVIQTGYAKSYCYRYEDDLFSFAQTMYAIIHQFDLSQKTVDMCLLNRNHSLSNLFISLSSKNLKEMIAQIQSYLQIKMRQAYSYFETRSTKTQTTTKLDQLHIFMAQQLMFLFRHIEHVSLPRARILALCEQESSCDMTEYLLEDFNNYLLHLLQSNPN